MKKFRKDSTLQDVSVKYEHSSELDCKHARHILEKCLACLNGQIKSGKQCINLTLFQTATQLVCVVDFENGVVRKYFT